MDSLHIVWHLKTCKNISKTRLPQTQTKRCLTDRNLLTIIVCSRTFVSVQSSTHTCFIYRDQVVRIAHFVDRLATMCNDPQRYMICWKQWSMIKKSAGEVCCALSQHNMVPTSLRNRCLPFLFQVGTCAGSAMLKQQSIFSLQTFLASTVSITTDLGVKSQIQGH